MEEVTKSEFKLKNSIQQKLKKAIRDYGMIEEGDHILIGLSGGKDSLALVELIGEQMQVFSPRFKATAVHVSVENIPYRSDLVFLEAFAGEYNIPFVHRITQYDESTDTRKSPCFLCSWNRRKVLFDTAKELGCNKIALGHHLDDIIETLLLNMFYQGNIGTIPPLLKMTKFDMTLIRPMALIPEQLLQDWAVLKGYPKQVKNCPYEKESSRTKIKKLVKQLEELHPSIRKNIWTAMENVQNDYLPHKIERN